MFCQILKSVSICVVLLLLINGCRTASETSPEAFREPLIESVAVWELEDLGPDRGSHADCGELLFAGVLDAFETSEHYTLVEREKLLLALEELHLGTSALADEETRLKIGRLVGARWMVFGTYLVIENNLRFDLRLVEVATGNISKTAYGVIPPDLSQCLNAARNAAKELL